MGIKSCICKEENRINKALYRLQKLKQGLIKGQLSLVKNGSHPTNGIRLKKKSLC